MALNTKKSLIPKANRKKIYESLFKEGVMVVRKDPKIEVHPDVKVPNLHVMMVMRSLESRGFVSEKFNWQHHYYTLNAGGIEELRKQLNLPHFVYPLTYTRPTKIGGGGRGEGPGNGVTDWRPNSGMGRGRPATERVAAE